MAIQKVKFTQLSDVLTALTAKGEIVKDSNSRGLLHVSFDKSSLTSTNLKKQTTSLRRANAQTIAVGC
jgi:hypothetical protein